MKYVLILLLALWTTALTAADLSAQFANPPDSARPWVYWFWNNGNVNKAGITADLEAMQRVGIGGVIIMDVVERFAPPPGDADFMSAKWQELFRFAVSEAHRLGLKINMTNGPGWCGSSGPWITPELSMQMLVTTNFAVTGPLQFAAVLPEPDTDSKRLQDGFNSKVKYAHYYRDIAVLAFPVTTNGIVFPEDVLNLTTNLDANGKLNWEVPAGQWIIERIGHTTTGSSTRPPVKGGNGLECDKLSREAMDVQFTNMMGKLIAEVGSSAGKNQTLVATHIDSWEVGSQNWTPKLREEFQKRRGYDPLPYLPDVTGANDHATIGDPEMARRFRWDFDQTISELLAENYAGRLAELAHEHGLRLSIEGYHLPFGDEATYTAQADEPMSEFWATGASENKALARQMASVAHVMGDKIVGAEAFTSGDTENWKFTPATVKALGDYEFSQGINRFVIHRYAFQPYLDRYPGSTMGPWGLHYERTQTWWNMSIAWHQYLARCQYMLRQGLFVADLCYLRPQLPDQTSFAPAPAVPVGYKYDECSAEALIARMNVKDGKLVLPDGMSYRLLVLPTNTRLMTPALVKKIKQLVADGATVFGPRPIASPSLSDFPTCDSEVVRLAAEVWGNCDGQTVTEHVFGKGKVIWGQPLEAVLEKIHTPPDFTSSVKLNWIHRQVGDTQVYFVANARASAVEAQCGFCVQGLRPELWNPKTGKISLLGVYEKTNGIISVPLRLEESGSTFVVFRHSKNRFDPVVNFTRNGQPVVQFTQPPVIKIQSATYGVPGDSARTRGVTAKLQTMINNGQIDFQVAKLAEGDDPAYGIVKTLLLNYTIDGDSRHISGKDPDMIKLAESRTAPECAAEIQCNANGILHLEASQSGSYELKTAGGKVRRAEIVSMPAPQEITGPWEVHFPPKWGAPSEITLDHLISLSDSPIAGVKYFSGTATYVKMFDWNPAPKQGNQKSEYWLDLGDVQVMAQVKLNGHELGILWKHPFRANVTGDLKPGQNTLEIRVADLWPNRMIGDAALPESERFTWSSYEPFTKDSSLPKSGLLGAVSIETKRIAELR
jgi:hypothetical protein